MDARATIRPARLDDEPVLSALIAASYARLDPALYPPGQLAAALPAMSRANPKLLAGGTYYVVEWNTVPAACGGWTHEEPGSGRLEPETAHIRHFATHPKHQGKGLARLLLAHCLTQAYRDGARRIRCWSTPQAVGFYGAAGFTRLRDIEVAMGANTLLHATEMERSLP